MIPTGACTRCSADCLALAIRSAYEPLAGPGFAAVVEGVLALVGEGFEGARFVNLLASSLGKTGALSGCFGFGAFRGGAGPLRVSLPALEVELGFPTFPFVSGAPSSALRFTPAEDDGV